MNTTPFTEEYYLRGLMKMPVPRIDSDWTLDRIFDTPSVLKPAIQQSVRKATLLGQVRERNLLAAILHEPRCSRFDPARTVIFIGMVARVVAASQHSSPDSVFICCRKSVFGNRPVPRFALSTSARRSSARLQRANAYDATISARASTIPHRLFVLIDVGKRFYGQSISYNSSQILKTVTARNHFYLSYL